MSENDLAVDLTTKSVAIGFPTGFTVPWRTAHSLARTAHACALRKIDMTILDVVGSSIITTARSLVVQRFLESDKQRLFWIDSDMVWEPEDFLRLLALSHKLSVVCAGYPLKRDSNGNEFVIFTDGRQVTMNQYGLLEIEGAGLGFCVMDRAVVEAVAAGKPTVFNQGTGTEMREVFRIDAFDGKLRGEDMAFFADVREAGHKVWLDPTIQLGHVGEKVYTGDLVKAFGLQKYFKAEGEK